MTGSKKGIFFVVAIVLAVFLAVTAFCFGQVRSDQSAFAAEEDEDVVLYAADKPLIVLLPTGASDEEKSAATVFSGFIQEITGAAPLIVEADPITYDKEGKGVVVIRLISSDAPYGSYLLRVGKDMDGNEITDKTAYVEGCDVRGLFNGVYAFLRIFCGVNIYSADVRVVPETQTVKLTDGYYLFYKPILEYADTDWISPHDQEFSVANGLNGAYSPIGAERGGRVNYITFCHSLTTSIVPETVYFESHPEYYALTKNGKREDKQLCLTNHAVIEQAKKDVLRLINEGYDDTSCLNIISVTQDDNQDYCLCENCTKIANKYGGQSGLMIWFVNQIADAVAASDHPDVLVDTFAYQYTRQAPSGIEPRSNVCVRLCTIECCFGHPIDDPHCEMNAAFMKDLDDWSKICSRMYIWDYTTNYAQALGIFPDFGVIQRNIDVFTAHNVVGIYEEGAYYASNCDVEFADLRAYLLARYMLDPMDRYGLNDGILDGFLQAYYGEGWQEVGQFIQYISDHAGDKDGHLYIYVSMAQTLRGVTRGDVNMIDDLWDIAEQKTADNVDALKRVRRSRVSWEYYKACNELGDYAQSLNVSKWTGKNAELIAMLEEFNVTQYSEGTSLSKIEPSVYLTPAEWGNGEARALYLTSFILTIVALVVAAAVTVLSVVRKKYALLSVPVSTVITCLLFLFTRSLFVAWVSPALFTVLGILIGLCLGTTVPAAIYALRSFRTPERKSFFIQYAIGAAAVLAVFAALLSIFALVVYDDGKPRFAYTVAFYWYQIVAIVSGVISALKLISEKKGK